MNWIKISDEFPPFDKKIIVWNGKEWFEKKFSSDLAYVSQNKRIAYQIGITHWMIPTLPDKEIVNEFFKKGMNHEMD